MRKRLAWLLLGVFLLISTAAWAQPQVPPAPTGSLYIQDYAGVVSQDSRARINSLGQQLAARTKAQVVVVTVKSLQGASVEEYALAILRQWGVGDKTLNNGVVILVAVGDRQSRVEVGYGLEGALPDAKTGRMQDEYMLPYFRQGDYDRGILNGYQAFVGEVAKEYKLEIKTDARAVQQVPAGGSNWDWDELPWWAKIAIAAGVLALFAFDWFVLGGSITYLLLSILSRRGGGGGGGGGGYGGGSGGGGGSSRRW